LRFTLGSRCNDKKTGIVIGAIAVLKTWVMAECMLKDSTIIGQSGKVAHASVLFWFINSHLIAPIPNA
jgi:hypothetical protein